MNAKTRQLCSAAEKNVKRLVDACRKNGPLYEQSPPVVAHVSRTGKWLLNAITKLHAQLENANAPGK